MKLQQNEGTPDRIIRIVAAAFLALVVVTGLVTAPVSVAVGIIAAILLATGATGFCPLYAIFGVSTCPRRA
jgi:ABC-type polysaccharide transport system permease subunit